jgi:hypothetical protein
MTKEIIQMKISLNDIQPEIWRRFIVPSSISLDDLHDIIQFVMGWTNTHLYGFYIKGTEFSPVDIDDEFESEAEDTKGKVLNKLNLKEKDTIQYIYDYGDNWEHTIKIEKISKERNEIKAPWCIEGARNCPPEDCGSIPGYEDIVTAMKNPESESAKEIVEWLGEPYNPEKFNLDEINSVF